MKYKKKDVLEQKISFKPMTKEQFEKLCKHFEVNSNKYPFFLWYYRFFEVYDSKIGRQHESYLSDDNNEYRSTKEISFEEFDFEEEFILPEKWCIKLTHQDVADYCIAYRNNGHNYRVDNETYAHFPPIRQTGDLLDFKIQKGYTEITLEQFQKYVSKNMENKKIIGYKLVKPEYEKAVAEIVKIQVSFCKEQFPDLTFTLQGNSSSIDLLRKAGVLDLWFEPIYKEQEQTVDMGSFSLKIKEGKVYHKDEDITVFVKEMVNLSKKIEENTPKSYRCQINKIVFGQTGCEPTETTLFKWLEVAQKANLI